MASRKKAKTTTDAVEILHRRSIEGKPEMEAILEAEEGKAEVAGLIYDLRTQAGLTQKELAQRVGTTASVISRLEDADYSGHSLTMLRRIAAAVGKSVQIRIVPLERSPKDESARPAPEPQPVAVTWRPGGDRWPDEPILRPEMISAPFDIPRLGTPVRYLVRPDPDRPADPPLPRGGADLDHV